MSHFTTYVITSSYVPRILIPEGSRCLVEQGCYPLVRCTAFTGNDPRKGWRIPLNEIKYNEQRDEETGFGYFGARYMDHELMTMWLSVVPMADKYPSISPYAYCAWTRPTGGDEHRWIKYNIVNNPIKLMDPDGEDTAYYNLDGKKQFVKIGGSDINMMVVTRKIVDERSFNKGGYYAFDVNDIDFNKMESMYNNSAEEGADVWYYRVRKDGTSTIPEELGPYGGKVQFAEDDKFNVHTHTLDNAVESNCSNLVPSMDKDCIGIGDRFGIILGYSKKDGTSSGALYSNGSTANRDNFIPSVSFYDRKGMIKLGGKSPTYETFKKKYSNYKLLGNETIKWKNSYYL